MKRGNVLFITIDQIRGDAISGALASEVPTPNLDRLAAEGTRFDRHFTVTLPCGPARASLLTGLYAMNHRSIRNGTPLARHHATVATEARKLGYEPLLFGYSDATTDPTTVDALDPDLLTYEGIARGFRELVEMRQETGLEWPAYLLARGYRLDLPADEPVPELYRPVPPAGRNEPALDDPALYSAQDSDTAYLTDRLLNHLSVRRNRPWFAHVAYIRPHPPLVAPAPYNRIIDRKSLSPRDLSVPAHPFIDAWFSAPSQKGLFWGFDGNCAAMSEETAATARAVYLGLIAEVDFHVGRVLDWLDETGQRDNTLVIVTGDHGEMLGDKRMWGKESVFDPAWHVPLLVSHPGFAGRAGTRNRAITESIDLAPTLLEFMGGDAPPSFDGRSLTLHTGQDDQGGCALLELDLSSPIAPTRYQKAWDLPENRCNVAILREDRWKYVHFNGGIAPMLFDLHNDPREGFDLAGDPAASGEISRLRGRMLDRRMERADRRLTGFSFGV